jgi:hypothetical protein
VIGVQVWARDFADPSPFFSAVPANDGGETQQDERSRDRFAERQG